MAYTGKDENGNRKPYISLRFRQHWNTFEPLPPELAAIKRWLIDGAPKGTSPSSAAYSSGNQPSVSGNVYGRRVYRD